MNVNVHEFYMNLAIAVSHASHAERNKVGALLVKDGNIVAFGYNGMPSGFDNRCETEQRSCNPFDTHKGESIIVTKPEVLHAESNAIAKCAKTAISCDGAILYVTTSPCFQCAKLIVQAGIKEVFYQNAYRDVEGIALLHKAKILCTKVLQ